MEHDVSVIDSLRVELKVEADAILRSAGLIDAGQAEKAFAILKNCQGKVVVTGIGKAGIVARKISATLASTGTTSIFLHAAEGIHGDLGMLQASDVVIAVSNSGNTQELLSIVPFIKFIGIPLIALTGNLDSQLASISDAVLDCSVLPESEALGIVPTSSTTVALAVGDALAILLLKERGFSLTDFARFHPGGNIGKKLLLQVKDIMHCGNELPLIYESADMSVAILEMTSKKLGCTAVVDAELHLLGMITDGDLRRQIQVKEHGLLQYSAAECMTKAPKSCRAEDLAVTALTTMEDYLITMLPVVDDENHVVGMLHMHDLIRAGII